MAKKPEDAEAKKPPAAGPFPFDMQDLLRRLQRIEVKDEDGAWSARRKYLLQHLILKQPTRTADLQFQPGIYLYWATLAAEADAEANRAYGARKETQARVKMRLMDAAEKVPAQHVIDAQVEADEETIEARATEELAQERSKLLREIATTMSERGRVLQTLAANERRDPNYQSGADWPDGEKKS